MSASLLLASCAVLLLGVWVLLLVARTESLRSLITDERHSLSTARCAFWLSLLTTLFLITAAAFGYAKLETAAYSLLSTIFVCLTAWAAGPRFAQYLLPQLGRVVSGIASGRGSSGAGASSSAYDPYGSSYGASYPTDEPPAG